MQHGFDTDRSPWRSRQHVMGVKLGKLERFETYENLPDEGQYLQDLLLFGSDAQWRGITSYTYCKRA